MSRKRTHTQTNKSSKKFKVDRPDPFGFDLAPHLSLIDEDTSFGEVSHHLTNFITGFGENGAMYKDPEKVWKTKDQTGLFATFEHSPQKVFKSGMHTKHTESVFKMAHSVLNELRNQAQATLGTEASFEFKQVDISKSQKQKRHKNANVLYLRAIHKGEWVVLKTTTDPMTQLIYVVDAIIHHHVHHTSSNYLTRLHFVAFSGEALVVCSGQMTETSVCEYVNNIRKFSPRPDIAVYNMVESFCLAIRHLQKKSHFTHRDCHTANVYYNPKNRCTRFIDFDWSVVRCGKKIISVPRYLYDTTRPQYGRNRSVDCCVFFRTLGHSLGNCPVFKEKIFDPLMQRYQLDCKQILQRKMDQGEKAAEQLYKMCTKRGNAESEFAHFYALQRNKDFDYVLGYYTFTSMTPDIILKFLRENKFF